MGDIENKQIFENFVDIVRVAKVSVINKNEELLYLMRSILNDKKQIIDISSD